MSTNFFQGNKFKTPKFRVSFSNVFVPNDYQGKKSYGLTMLYPKTDPSAMELLKAEAAKVAKAKWGDAIPANLLTPFTDCDGDTKSYDGYAGRYFIKAQNYVTPGHETKAKPVIVNQSRTPVYTESEFYSGCYAHAYIVAKATGGPGTQYQARVSFGLVSAQKLADGEPFGGQATNPDEEYDVLPDDPNAPTETQAAGPAAAVFDPQQPQAGSATVTAEQLFS